MLRGFIISAFNAFSLVHYAREIREFYKLLQEKEVSTLREDQLQVIQLRNEVTKLHSAEQSSKLTAGRIQELETIIQQLTAELECERKEKEHAVAERESICREKDEVSDF